MPGRNRPRAVRVAAALAASAALAVSTLSCTAAVPAGREQGAQVLPAAHTRQPAAATSVLAGAPDQVAQSAASALFASAPVVVVVRPGQPARLAAAATSALRAHAPLLLTGGGTNGGTAATAASADAMLRARISALHPRAVLAVGTGFGPTSLLASRIAVARTGVQLPGGGQVLFPGRLLVALYGHPGAPALGVLGHQKLPASIARARQAAAPYRALSR